MQQFTSKEKLKYLLGFPVIVAALGYFVDIYDLLLFGIVRVPSLKSLGLDVDVAGTHIINFQVIGLLLGGILWTIVGAFWFYFSLFFSQYRLWVFTSNAFCQPRNALCLLAIYCRCRLGG
jgi:hypothetical protein